MNIQDVRNLFPHLKNGKVYFNHASTAPLSERVLDAVNSRLKLQSGNNIDDYLLFLKTAEETKNLLGRLINCSSSRIAFLDNTSNGINLLAQSVKWEKGARIILNDLEFPANVYPFLNLQRKGVEIDFVKSKNGKVSAEDVIELIKPETKLISISFVQFLTGYKVDLEMIGCVCREKGIIFCVDAIQGLGAVKLDVEKDKVDFISCGTQKWLLGLQGFAFIFITKDLQEKLDPAFAGWLGVEDAWNLLDYNLKLKSSAEALQTGTINTLGVYALNASLKLFEEFGFDDVEKRVLSNTEYFTDHLVEVGIEPMLAGCSRNNLSGILSFKSENAQYIFEKLAAKNITAAVREGVLRLSPHFYNTYEEIDEVVNELKPIS